jgi:hypothetical protein
MTCIKIFGIEIAEKFGNEISGLTKIFANEMRSTQVYNSTVKKHVESK